ncbi:Uma2 family endonuclease [Streptomyces sp. PSKA54]|uniref:Uma2 family endonuclease n=1 Tax=Streptomyces himalayensis subsp. aureolus TaxID=2758039 RepID=A0A7W2CYM4_9ACTN|nr:Uma2 family endonuclease [Streptomyces himalayensis]MBA4861295.1 Uma2 family endonuclease [Streptomyces himalayensis subsp. aureolus]
MIERPKTIEGPTPGDFEDMLRTVEELDTPDGYKAELIRGKIVVSPWSKLRYLRPMRKLRQQLEAHAPEGHITETSPFLFTFPHAGRGFGPDLFVADEAAFEADGRHADGTALSLVAELTSESTKDVDWLDKLDTYGRVVPVYLVLDMQAQEISALWGPSPKGYRSRTNVPFGRPLHVPAPFDFELDTSGFVMPPKDENEDENEAENGEAGADQ